jgi:hypothetical protein
LTKILFEVELLPGSCIAALIFSAVILFHMRKLKGSLVASQFDVSRIWLDVLKFPLSLYL